MGQTIPEFVTFASTDTWQRILSEWHTVLAQYRKQVQTISNECDVPWWYNERASVGFLAAAIWKSGGVALEEFATSKADTETTWSGRTDLYAIINSSEFHAEAKHVWVNADMRETNKETDIFRASAQAGLSNARGAADANKAAKGMHYGIVFVTPRLRTSHAAASETVVQQWYKDFEALQCTSKAWHFPKDTRTVAEYDQWLYPGAAICIEPIEQ